MYGEDYRFEFGKAHVLRQSDQDAAVIVSSGRGVHEALAAAELCAAKGISVGVVDMCSIDEELLVQLYRSGKLICIAEQNNGYILQNLFKVLYRNRTSLPGGDLRKIVSCNTLDREGRAQFIHSGTYEELIAAFGLDPEQLAARIEASLS